MASKTANSIHKQIREDSDKSLYLKRQLEDYYSQMKNNYLGSCADFFGDSNIINEVVAGMSKGIDIESIDHDEINERALIIMMDVFNEGIIQFSNQSIEIAKNILEKLALPNENDKLS